MQIDWNTIERPIIGLAPMADMTDSPFCRIVKSLSSPIVFREMVSAEAIVRGNDKTMMMADIHPDERPLVQQIFGSDPDTMAEAARIVEESHHPEAIDVNMGCPVYKINKNFNGAALMKEPDRAAEIVRKMKATVSVPVSVKMRAGWSDTTECIEFSKRMEDAGADLVSVHGRTKKQAYAGKADWNMIKQVKKRVTIPVLANGDILTAELALKALEQTNCDGVLIARGALGNPWIFKQIEEQLSGKPISEISIEERIKVVREHIKLHVEQYGERGVVTFRKHLSWYFKGQPGVKQFRQQLHTVSTVDELDALFDSMLQK